MVLSCSAFVFQVKCKNSPVGTRYSCPIRNHLRDPVQLKSSLRYGLFRVNNNDLRISRSFFRSEVNDTIEGVFRWENASAGVVAHCRIVVWNNAWIFCIGVNDESDFTSRRVSHAFAIGNNNGERALVPLMNETDNSLFFILPSRLF